MSDLKDTLLRFTKGVSKTSGEILKSTKLSLALASEEDKLKQLYMEIGKKVHEIYQYGGTLGKFFDEKYAEIQQTETAIFELKNQMNMIKGVKSCTKCGASIERTAEFCPKCGYRLDTAAGSSHAERQYISADERLYTPAPEQPPATEQPSKPPEINIVICRNCQAKNEPGSKFCLTCGRMI